MINNLLWNELGFVLIHSPVNREIQPIRISELVKQYIESEWHKEPVPYERSFIAFLHDSHPEKRFEPISDAKWEMINNQIKRSI